MEKKEKAELKRQRREERKQAALEEASRPSDPETDLTGEALDEADADQAEADSE